MPCNDEQVPVHKPIFGVAKVELILRLSMVPVATKEYQTSCAFDCCEPPTEQPVKNRLLNVASTVVPDVVTAAPLPFGQAGVAGRDMLCALVQLSLAGGIVQLTSANNTSTGNKLHNAFKL